MLELIAQYADREVEGIRLGSGFTTKLVKWRIELKSTGEFHNVVELGTAGEKKNQGLSFSGCPEYPSNEMQSGGKAHPLVESLNVVALLAKNAEESETEKDRVKHLHFVELLEEMSGAVPETAIAARALSDEATLSRIQKDLYENKAKPTDKVTLEIGGIPLLGDKRLEDWWISKRNSGRADVNASAVCLVTGEPVVPLPTHPKIGGLASVGGLAIGSSLISFDKGAFASFGLDQSANAPVSEESANKYRAGLNQLIANGKRLGPLIVSYWFSGVVPVEDDPLGWLEGGDEGPAAMLRARKMLDAVRSGERTELADYRYHILTLSGAAGRVMLRGWEEGAFVDLVKAIDGWFDDLSIVSSDGLHLVRGPKFMAVAGSTVRVLDDLAAPAESALWNCAVKNGKIPLSAVRGALNRVRIDILENQLRPIRMGLLKAYLIRNENHPMQSNLNPDDPDKAYQAGRLMAVLANVQLAALGNVNANVVQRFYAAASSSPALVFGRLIRQANFHLGKMDPGLARHLELKLAEVCGRVEGDLPATFSLEQQTKFALGYYQQVAQDFNDRTQASAKKTAKSTNQPDEAEEAQGN